ncbi:hypothetical protein H4R18_003727, partial [Coemansia javaensis]
DDRADELAGKAHADEVQEWSLQLGPPPGRLFGLTWDEHCVPAAPNAVRPDVSVGDQELYGQMAALNWVHSGDGCYAEKKCNQRTPDYGSTERSLGLKVLLGTPPAMQRQTARHLNAYPEAGMRERPKGRPEAAPGAGEGEQPADAGDDRADELAGKAHADEVQEWLLQPGPPPGRLLWLVWDEHCVPAAPNAVRPGFSVGDQELYGQMVAFNWFHSGDGCYVEKK